MTHPVVRTFAAALGLALFAGAACRAASPQPPPPPDEGAQAKPGEGKAGPDAGAQAESPEMEKVLKELAQGRTVQDQQRIAESQRHYELALAAHNKGDFERAKVECQEALKAWRENREAQALLKTVGDLIVNSGGRFGAPQAGDEEVKRFKVKIEQAQIEITKHIRDGERYFNARMYEEAVKEFEDAQFQITHIPYDIKAMNDLLPKVREYAVKSKNAAVREKASVEAEKKKMAEAEAEAHETAMKREITKKIAHLLEMSYMAFDQRRFDKCIKLCDEVLLIDPHYTVAGELREDAEKTRHKEEYYSILAKKVEEWKKLTDSDERAVIPWSETVRFPSREEWAEISKRIGESVIKTQEGTGAEEDPDILAINRKLDTMKIDFSFDNAKLEDIIAYIRDFTGLNIILDPAAAAQGALDKAIPFKVKDLVLKNALKLLLQQFGLDYSVTEEKIVLISTPQKSGGKPVLELHDIRDILVKLQDFVGPRVELVAPGGQGGRGGGPLTGATFTLDEPKEASVGEEQIVNLIKENIAPGTWEGEYTIDKTPNQQLLVNAPPQVHRELREFLGKLRSYTGTMVSVTCRFLSAYDDFLDDVGVDIINRANIPPAVPGLDTPGTGLTSVDDPSGEIGPGFVSTESMRLESWDLRGTTFNTLLKSDRFAGTTDPLSNRLTNQGGLGLQYQWIGEQALQMVLRALHKSQKATLLQAPSVTVFNGQRSHVMFVTQLAYIEDYEPQVAALAAAYDPVIGILNQGVVFDVRPIVSNDRKFVTLELRPSLADLQFMRTLDIRPGANIILQLPWVVLQKAETTVMIPDRGTLLISGFKDIAMRDVHSGIPFLEDIPFLSFFFTRKGKSDERRRLHMLVTPEIIDLQEHEDRRF